MTMPNLQGSTPQGGGPTLRCFGVGRAVIIFPIAEEMGTAFDGKEPKPFIRSNIVALPDQRSAPFITFGGEVLQDGVTVKTPDTHRVDLGPHGWMAENVKVGGGGMLYILRAALRTNSARVGRLFKDPQFNNAWKLTDPDKDEPQLMEQAAWWVQLYGSGQFVNSVPVPVSVVPQQQMPIQQVPQQQGWQQQGWQQSQPAQQAQQGWQQPAPPAQQPVYAGPPPAQQGWSAPQQPQPAQQDAYAAATQYPTAAQPPQAQAPQGWSAPPPGWGQPAAPQQPQGDPNAAPVPHPGF